MHDRNIEKKAFLVGDNQVLVISLRILYNSRMKLFPEKLLSRWSGPFVVNQMFSHGAVEVTYLDGKRCFKVNGNCLKPYYEGAYVVLVELLQCDLTS